MFICSKIVASSSLVPATFYIILLFLAWQSIVRILCTYFIQIYIKTINKDKSLFFCVEHLLNTKLYTQQSRSSSIISTYTQWKMEMEVAQTLHITTSTTSAG